MYQRVEILSHVAGVRVGRPTYSRFGGLTYIIPSERVWPEILKKWLDREWPNKWRVKVCTYVGTVDISYRQRSNAPS